jgi:hypothetical protein
MATAKALRQQVETLKLAERDLRCHIKALGNGKTETACIARRCLLEALEGIRLNRATIEKAARHANRRPSRTARPILNVSSRNQAQITSAFASSPSLQCTPTYRGAALPISIDDHSTQNAV